MKPFRDAVREVNTALGKIFVFEILLNAFIVFLAAYLITAVLFRLPVYYAAACTAFYAAFFAYRRLHRNKMRIVEERYPELNEKLRTAVEYQYDDNPVVDELQADVLRELKRVEEAAFFSNRDTYAKIGVVVALSFLIFFFSPVSLAAFFNVDAASFFPSGDRPVETAETGRDGSAFVGSEEAGDQFGSEDIYGTAFIAPLGNRELKLMLNPGGFEMDVRRIYDPQPLTFDEAYPDDVFAVSGEVFEENIPLEQQEVVKNYFKQLAEGG